MGGRRAPVMMATLSFSLLVGVSTTGRSGEADGGSGAGMFGHGDVRTGRVAGDLRDGRQAVGHGDGGGDSVSEEKDKKCIRGLGNMHGILWGKLRGKRRAESDDDGTPFVPSAGHSRCLC